MVKVRIHGDDARKDDDGFAHVTWGEAQDLLAAGNAEIVQGEDAEDQPAAGGDDFDNMTRADLDSLAEERGVDVSGAKTKADVIEALRRG